MATIKQALQAVLKQIRKAETQHKRIPGSVALLAVSKTWPATAILEAAAAGQVLFGENYVQESVEKFDLIKTGHPELNLEWHFIGHLQSNKSRDIATRFDWVHSVDRLKLAKRLSDQRPDGLAPLNICLQVNINNEANKSGFSGKELTDAALQIAQLPRLQLRGLMAIPTASKAPMIQHQNFAQLRQLQLQLIKQGLPMDTLSMGMSGDMDAAIAEGSNIVRIGTAIFGQRHDNKT